MTHVLCRGTLKLKARSCLAHGHTCRWSDTDPAPSPRPRPHGFGGQVDTALTLLSSAQALS